MRGGLASLQQQKALGDFQEGELDRLLAEGEQGGKSLDGEQVLAELAELRAGRTNSDK